MRKLKEVLRLASLGLSQHQIARSCSLSQSTVHEYVSAASASGVQLPIPADWNDNQIEQTLFPQRTAPIGWRKHPGGQLTKRNIKHAKPRRRSVVPQLTNLGQSASLLKQRLQHLPPVTKLFYRPNRNV